MLAKKEDERLSSEEASSLLSSSMLISRSSDQHFHVLLSGTARSRVKSLQEMLLPKV